ncbi:MAG TPA: biotin carboxylase N-terminal domain-containing protein [Steroidobacteraceae bacterium]
MIKSLLVANRGEIACRIFRTARRLGVRTVAVFSDADAGARHVRAADEAVHIGPAPARASYLDGARIIAAARATGAQAIHPGYGFLSENARFAQECAAAGLIFVGPPASSIAAMGSKILAKTRMQAKGVPVLPGYAGERQDLEHLKAAALAAGLPLIVKPAAGGGGKGMQIIREPAQIEAALAAARRLAESAFGDGALLLERFLATPRHIEVQIFADSHGNFVHLGDRDCSTQRRHQKLIEEAPAPGLPDPVRARMRQAALVVAREIGYVGAGTVEFLFDGGEFYFMEMNTRLQVEHTVTEAVTGLDLVEWQLLVACGESLPLTQEAVRLDGHAIEARVCAEDPERGFLPSAGRLALLEWPRMQSVRVDAGFASGDEVPDTYDSLLGKVIAWAPDRTGAATRLAHALTHTYSAGVRTNEHWLARVLTGSRFLEVRHNIALLDQDAGEFTQASASQAESLILAALVARPGLPPAGAAVSPWQVCDAFTPNREAGVQLRFSRGTEAHVVALDYMNGVPVRARCDAGAAVELADVVLESGTVAARLGALRRHARYFREGARVHVWLGAEAWEFILDDPRTREFTSTAAHGGLTSPLPGVVVAVPVSVGQAVAAGELLMVIEAMKMEHAITAPHAGTVAAIHFTKGERVPEGGALLELTAA